ncbi:5'-methylthioadenosine/S-adenosylhomocysteine nucleosidase [Mariniplasma anaerobium]|uniref:adenosylhomocysteine nucleosidase n=1 Tax=Mariniplasma anaerobium TaxID=2735436 RepID=A0A7U9TKV5_9MOLU|nr:5'-methylthioadenosine/S-adenosylhomocysteine nucleosidase [Mariniplasma anaerobium]BCR36517.1 5'-methylthioadenosine/S-adenosylhomocysteine nucleosidase [Mariniplasma anaerobium]
MILIVAAMKEEVSEILKIKSETHDVLVTGVGKVNAAMKLTEYLSNHRVDRIINLGFAGGNMSYEVNDVVLINHAVYHDFDLTLFGYKKGQVPGYPEVFTSDENMFKRINKKLDYAKQGSLYTGDYFMTTPVEQPAVFDMEGASFYQVAHYFNVPMISIKLISDVIGMKDHFKHYKAFEQTSGAHLLAKVFKDVLEVSYEGNHRI